MTYAGLCLHQKIELNIELWRNQFPMIGKLVLIYDFTVTDNLHCMFTCFDKKMVQLLIALSFRECSRINLSLIYGLNFIVKPGPETF